MAKTWKQIKLNVLKEYRKYYDYYAGYEDDRGVYCRMYEMIAEAIQSLAEEPPLYIRCALARELHRDFETMEEIIERFEFRGKS